MMGKGREGMYSEGEKGTNCVGGGEGGCRQGREDGGERVGEKGRGERGVWVKGCGREKSHRREWVWECLCEEEKLFLRGSE